MKVELIAHTDAPDDLCDIIAGECYKSVGKEVKPSKDHIRLKKVIESGHTSVLEHATFTFKITGLSRVALGELTRHRIGCSYTVQSSRYIQYDNESDIAPVLDYLVDDIPVDCLDDMYVHMKDSVKLYNKLIDDGMKPEDARLVLPFALTTDMVVTMNARALYNFFNLRMCHRAYWEMQELAWQMYEIVKRIAPVMFLPKYCMPNCVRDKRCKESKPCGDPIKIIEQ